MNTRALARTNLLSRFRPLRIWDWLATRWRRWCDSACERRQLDREVRELAAVAALDARMLRDIGIPDWAQAEASRRLQASRFEHGAPMSGGWS
jgi:hypothetical protein